MQPWQASSRGYIPSWKNWRTTFGSRAIIFDDDVTEYAGGNNGFQKNRRRSCLRDERETIDFGAQRPKGFVVNVAKCAVPQRLS